MSPSKRNSNDAAFGFRAACEVQQDFAKASVLHSEVVWDVFGPEQSDLLSRKLDFMFHRYEKVCVSKESVRNFKKIDANINGIKHNLLTNIWKQRKYTNGVLLHSIIYVLVTSDLDMENAKLAYNYTIHPVFRTRRCLNSDNSVGCCMMFIDEKSRIYQNWNDFVNNNELPYGIMIAPKNGCYSLNEKKEVKLECSFTPAYSYQALTVTDTIVTVTSLVAQTATLFNPFFSLLTIATKSYEAVRNYQKMSDQVAKGTTSNYNANINLTRDIISLTSTVATFGASMKLSTGEQLSFGTELGVQAVNGAASLIHCTQLIETSYDIFTRCFVDGEELVFSDFLAFSSSLILFTNSINNIALISKTGNIDGNALRSLLQSKIRAGLSFVSAKGIKHGSQNDENVDVLRLINDIPYKDVFYNMHKVYSNLTRSGFLATLSVLGAAAVEISSGLHIQVFDKKITELDMEGFEKHYGKEFVEHIANCHNLIDVLNGIGLYFPVSVVHFLFDQIGTFFETKAKVSQQSPFITTEMILYKMFSFIIKNYKCYTIEFLDKKKEEILLSATSFFESLNPNPTDKESEKYNCNVCGGYYYLNDK